MAAKPTLFISQIADQLSQKNFQNLQDYFLAQNQLQDFAFKELVFTGAVTNQAVPHSLGYTPKDVLVTHKSGVGAATFQWGQFTPTNMYISTSGACRLRFFYGTYWNFTSNVNDATADAQTIT